MLKNSRILVLFTFYAFCMFEKGAVMMGKQTSGQEQLFYGFNLESHVPQDHLLRGINHILDLGDLRQHLADYYSFTGRPSIDPDLMIRMRVIGYCFGRG